MHPSLGDDVETSADVAQVQAVPLCDAEIISALEVTCRMAAALAAGNTSVAIGKERTTGIRMWGVKAE